MAGRVPAPGDWTELCGRPCKRLHPTLYPGPHTRAHLLKLLIFRCSIAKAAPPPGKSMRGPDRAGAPEGLQARRLPLEHLPGLRPEQRRELGPQQGPLQPGCGSRLQTEAATWDHGHTGPQLPRAGWGRGPRPADSRCTWPLRLERGCKGEAELGLWVDRMLTAPREHLL